MSGFLESTEFLVVMFTLASLLVGLIVRPHRRGQAETSFAGGELYADDDLRPRVEFRYTSSGALEISRCGLSDLTSTDSVALAITRIGFDIEIEERIVRNEHSGGSPVQRAIFLLHDLAPERYHIKYNSSAYSTFLAVTLPLREGLRTVREFPQ